MVPAFSADDFLARYPDARPDLIKIDIEGGETDFLSGAPELLQNIAPQILLALHGEDQAHNCSAILQDNGYSLFYLDGSPVIDQRFKSDEIYARRNDVQLSLGAGVNVF